MPKNIHWLQVVIAFVIGYLIRGLGGIGATIRRF